MRHFVMRVQPAAPADGETGEALEAYCNKAKGSFSTGTSIVECNTTNSGGSTGFHGFIVNVTDVGSPQLNCPAVATNLTNQAIKAGPLLSSLRPNF